MQTVIEIGKHLTLPLGKDFVHIFLGDIEKLGKILISRQAADLFRRIDRPRLRLPGRSRFRCLWSHRSLLRRIRFHTRNGAGCIPFYRAVHISVRRIHACIRLRKHSV